MQGHNRYQFHSTRSTKQPICWLGVQTQEWDREIDHKNRGSLVFKGAVSESVAVDKTYHPNGS